MSTAQLVLDSKKDAIHVEGEIAHVLWARDANTAGWRVEVRSVQPPPATAYFTVRITSSNQAELSSFHDKVLSAMGKVSMTLRFIVDGPTSLVTVNSVDLAGITVSLDTEA